MRLIMIYSAVVTFLALQAAQYAPAQETVKHDSLPGFIKLGQNLDSLSAYFGPPAAADTLDQEPEMRTYIYGFGLIVWVDTTTNEISSFDISSPRFCTGRGVRVGDSLDKLKRTYGKGERDTELRRLHDNYDYQFKDFSEVYLYAFRSARFEGYRVFYIKDSTVVKIYFYIGLSC